ncbi:pyruvate kinase [Pyrobaculum aerophilum]|uniref:pyruvate kinase n=1 Tax=Pyrobaculum aerophilum TaxID=13773 RepID=UPI0023F4A449|nr:pyruvate kinase [Pyrobaculum aerophilum]MCX8136249.1 pyruvate kinase [Pyrobaculum aerophilum]
MSAPRGDHAILRARNLTKRVATLGPSTDVLRPDELIKFLDLVDGVRINLAHASPNEVKFRIEAVRSYEKAKNRPLAVIVDLKGPSIRVGSTSPINVQEGEVVKFKLSDKSDGTYIPVPNKAFFSAVEQNDVILMLDGRLRLKVTNTGSDWIEAVAESSGVITGGKAIVVEGKDYDISTPAEEDVEALKAISPIRDNIDYVAISLAKSCKDVDSVRSLLTELGFQSQVAVKIETKGAINNLEELVQCSDYVVVARGDLGLHYGLDALPIVQRRIVHTSLKYGKPIAVATQLLDSMQSSPIPTRAEINDVFTTASMGVDSLWLTNETASGKYPLAAVSWLSRILMNVEYQIPQSPLLQNSRDRFAKGLVELTQDLGANILVFSMSGTLARRIAKFRPRGVVYVGTPNVRVARSLSIVWALEPLYIPAENYEEGLEKLISLKGTTPFVATYGIRGGVHSVKVKL